MKETVGTFCNLAGMLTDEVELREGEGGVFRGELVLDGHVPSWEADDIAINAFRKVFPDEQIVIHRMEPVYSIGVLRVHCNFNLWQWLKIPGPTEEQKLQFMLSLPDIFRRLGITRLELV